MTALAFLLLACSCQSKKDQNKKGEQSEVKEPAAQLQEQLSRDSIALSNILSQYPENIRSNFQWCDSMLQYLPEEQIDDYFETLNLAQAYLHQFDDMLPRMQQTISYTRQQLTNLQNDIDTHYINDSLATVYMADETAVADTLHQRILYFQDRLSQQDQILTALRETIRKAASK